MILPAGVVSLAVHLPVTPPCRPNVSAASAGAVRRTSDRPRNFAPCVIDPPTRSPSGQWVSWHQIVSAQRGSRLLPSHRERRPQPDVARAGPHLHFVQAGVRNPRLLLRAPVRQRILADGEVHEPCLAGAKRDTA